MYKICSFFKTYNRVFFTLLEYLHFFIRTTFVGNVLGVVDLTMVNTGYLIKIVNIIKLMFQMYLCNKGTNKA